MEVGGHLHVSAVLFAGISPRYPLKGQLVNPRVVLELENRKLNFPFPGIDL